MKIKNYTTMKISETFCSLKTTATVFLLGVLLLANTTVNAQNNALHFDGTDDYVELPATINGQITGNNITIEGWFYIEAIDDQVTLVGETYSGGTDKIKFELFNLNGSIAVDFHNGNNSFPYTSSPLPPLTTWVHIAATYDGANLRLFYNGAEVASAATTLSLPTTGTGTWLMGKRPDAPGQFKGKMDEIRIWNTTRSAGDILANYTKQVPDNSAGLIAYYKMNQGVAGGNNPSETMLTNSSLVPLLNGTLEGPFDLSGSTSNFVTKGSTVWGTSWSDGAPNAGLDAIIDGTYTTAIDGAVVANSLTVNSAKSFTINSGTNVTVQHDVINNGTLVVENNANLIQVNNAPNTGAINVNRNSSSLLRLDYTLWSSPVSSQNLAAFSPLTSQSPSRFFTFDTGFGINGQYNEITSPTTTPFVAGAGYLIRMPNDASAVTPTAYPGVFTGIPNNGDVPVTLIDGGLAGLRYNLVGNPYPSPIKMSNFVFDNTANIQSTLYFWRKTNNLGTAYCTWVAGPLVTDPGTFVTNGNLQTFDPLGVIQTGQGFFVEAKSGASSLTFKNTQRLANNAGQFFKTKRVTLSGKIWINATNLVGNFSQMAITYFPEATLGIDPFDGKYFNDSKMALSSNINNEEYTIQSRPAFDVSDKVALIFKTDKAGDYTIAIDHVNGLFSNGQDIYLVDSKTGTETNLKTGSYNFIADSGVDNTRFSLKYQKTLKVDAPLFNENSVSVYSKNGTLYVNAGEIAINNIQVYDVQGRLLAERRNVKASTATLENLKANNQVLLVKISGANNEEVTKKVLN